MGGGVGGGEGDIVGEAEEGGVFANSSVSCFSTAF